MFRNLTFFRYPPTATHFYNMRSPGGANGHLDTLLAENALQPVGPSELTRRGWVPLLRRDLTEGEGLAYWVGDSVVVLALGIETRLLPPSVVEAEVRRRLAKIEEAEGRRLGGRAIRRLKEDVVADLLPRALVKPSRVVGYLDLARGLVVVDTASRKAAEGFVSEIRSTLGSFPALPLNAECSPRSVLTACLSGQGWADDGRGAVSLGDEVELRDPVDGGAVAKLRHQELTSDEVYQHLDAGKMATALALVFNERAACTVLEDLSLRKFTLLDVVLEQHHAADHDSMEAELDARYTLLAAEVGAVFDRLADAFRLSPVEG